VVRDAQNVGLTAGTSTLRETVAAVHERLQEFAVQNQPALA
jgi:4-hydroxy-3-methylbut-2-enyl diphosphate reductase IspH